MLKVPARSLIFEIVNNILRLSWAHKKVSKLMLPQETLGVAETGGILEH